MINIVIPMAGAGSRFTKAGYTTPKPFIEFFGMPMIYHVLKNLNIADSQFILICRTEHLANEKRVFSVLQNEFNIKIICTDKLTEGPACSVLLSHRLINNNSPLLIANSDQIIDIDPKAFIGDCVDNNFDGSVLCFNDSDPKWSYAKTTENGTIIEIREKEVISEYATSGIYYFAKGSTFIQNCIDMIVNNDRVNNEFYVAPVYNYAIRSGFKFCIYTIEKSKMHGIGTPEDLNHFITGNKKYGK